MSKIKVAELFYSIQGEGRYMGVPSIFLRTFGCNFTCDGFGMSRGEKSNERNLVAANIKLYQNYKDLPLVSTGCDSYASWDPRFKHLSPLLTVDSIATATVNLLPSKSWEDEHLVITGGEPLLGWQKSYSDLLSHEEMISLKELTFETNGTQEITKEFRHFLLDWTLRTSLGEKAKLNGRRGWDRLTFSVSPKLPVSGEKWEAAIKPNVVVSYEEIGYTYLKFVIASQEDAEDTKKAVKEYRDAGFKGPVYVMPVGGVESVYHLNNKTVALIAMENGWRYSDRLQIPLFKNEWGT